MNRTLPRAMTAAIALLAGSAALAQADAPPKRNTLKESQPSTGTYVKRVVVSGGAVPYDKRYEELTAEQKAMVRAQYEAMPETDEPPFPLGGLQAVYGRISEAYRRMQWPPEGELDLHVAISATGQPVSVEIYHLVDDPTFVRFVASVVMTTPYKPAVCGGQPCAMSFPVRMQLTRDVPRP